MNGVLEGLVDGKVVSVINVFVKNRNELFHIKKVSELSNVPLATSFRIIRRLVSLGFVSVIKVGKFKVYRLAENKKTRLLVRLLEK